MNVIRHYQIFVKKSMRIEKYSDSFSGSNFGTMFL